MSAECSKIVKSDRMLRVLAGERVDRPPLWLMRQAGRYLPEYRALRAESPDFLKFLRKTDHMVQAALQPLQRFPLDASIVFSDILVLPAAMGAPLRFVKGEGPLVSPPISEMADVRALRQPKMEQDCDFVLAAVKQTKAALAGSLPLIGFAGAPWTVACYLLQGCSGKAFAVARQMAYAKPAVVQALIESLIESTVAYLAAQARAGADILMLFDSWAGLCSPDLFTSHVYQPLQRIIAELKNQGITLPMIVFARGANTQLHRLTDIGATALAIDWTMPLSVARESVGDEMVLQGNFDPMLLFADPKIIKQTVQDVARSIDTKQGYILNLGHGIDQHTPIVGVEALCEAVVGLSDK